MHSVCKRQCIKYLLLHAVIISLQLSNQNLNQFVKFATNYISGNFFVQFVQFFCTLWISANRIKLYNQNLVFFKYITDQCTIFAKNYETLILL